jgi:hypothetical protein
MGRYDNEIEERPEALGGGIKAFIKKFGFPTDHRTWTDEQRTAYSGDLDAIANKSAANLG